MKQSVIGQGIATSNMMSANSPGIQTRNHRVAIRSIALSISLSLLDLYPRILAHNQGEGKKV